MTDLLWGHCNRQIGVVAETDRTKKEKNLVLPPKSTKEVLHKERRFGDTYNRHHSHHRDMECNKNFNTRDRKSANCAPAPSCSIKTSFWTQCSACQMKFEYLICYLSKRLRCRSPSCRKPYVAIEIPPPLIDGNSSSNSKAVSEAQAYPDRVGRQISPAKTGSTSSSGIYLPEKVTSSYDTLTKFASDKAAPAPASHYPPSAVLEPVVWHRRRGREEAAAAVRETCSEIIQMSKKAHSGSVGMPSDVNFLETEGIKKSRVGKGGMNKKVAEDASQVSFANCRRLGTGRTSGSRKGQLEDRRRVNFSVINQFNSLRNLSPAETEKMLMHKAKKKIFEKLGEWSSEKEPTDGLNSSQGKMKQKYHEEQKAPANGTKAAAVKHRKPVDGIGGVYIKKTSCAISNVESEAENFVFKQTLVADPDFHDFDNDRTEVSFADNQVWAAYDGDDRMPRYYALIHNVITLRPFKVNISWLSSKSDQELGPMPWVGSGFAKTCGDLWIGKSIVYGSLNAFSHMMRWTKSSRGLIQIYPLKGDVWALYRNWSSDWNESTPNDVKQSYDMVEVVEGSSKDCGVTIAPLIKVCGLKTVFRKHPDPCTLWTIPREELLRFSHQVPAHLITGEEGANAPIGCWELDPASTPLEL